MVEWYSSDSNIQRTHDGFVERIKSIDDALQITDPQRVEELSKTNHSAWSFVAKELYKVRPKRMTKGSIQRLECLLREKKEWLVKKVEPFAWYCACPQALALLRDKLSHMHKVEVEVDPTIGPLGIEMSGIGIGLPAVWAHRGRSCQLCNFGAPSPPSKICQDCIDELWSEPDSTRVCRECQIFDPVLNGEGVCELCLFSFRDD